MQKWFRVFIPHKISKESSQSTRHLLLSEKNGKIVRKRKFYEKYWMVYVFFLTIYYFEKKIPKHSIFIIAAVSAVAVSAVSAVASLCPQSVPLAQISKGNIRHHHVQAKYKRGWKSLDTPHSSSVDSIILYFCIVMYV